MTKEEIKNYIKENLSISVYESDYDFIKEVDIILCIEGEEINRERLFG